MPVPALKEQIASVTGVLSEQQRLICRGKVLKDDQLLSAYRILTSRCFQLWKNLEFHCYTFLFACLITPFIELDFNGCI